MELAAFNLVEEAPSLMETPEVKTLSELPKSSCTQLEEVCSKDRISVCLLIEAPPSRPEEFEFSLIDVVTNEEIPLEEIAVSKSNRIICTKIAILGDYLDYENREFWRTVNSRDIVHVVNWISQFMNQCQLEIDQVDLLRALPIIAFFHRRFYFSDLRLTYYNQPFTPLMKSFVEDQVSLNNPNLHNVHLEGDMLPTSFQASVSALLARQNIPGISLNAMNMVFGFDFFERILLHWFSLPNPTELESLSVFAYFDFEREQFMKYLTVVDPEDELVLGRRFVGNGAVVSCKINGQVNCVTLHFFGRNVEFISDEDAPLFDDNRLTY